MILSGATSTVGRVTRICGGHKDHASHRTTATETNAAYRRNGKLALPRFRVASASNAHHLTRHKISDRAGERGWPHAGRTNYAKATHRSGRGSLHRMVRLPVKKVTFIVSSLSCSEERDYTHNESNEDQHVEHLWLVRRWRSLASH